ncbi:MAG: flippase-like domain-containing protein [Candidatus Diapherotrites archaeon]
MGNRAVLALRIAAGIAIIFFLAYFAGIGGILEKIASFNPFFLFPIIILTILVLVVGALNLHRLLSPLGKIGFFELFKNYCVSFAFGYIAPGKIGDFSLSVLLKEKFRPGESSAIILMDKIVTLSLYSAISIAALFIFFGIDNGLRVSLFLAAGFIILFFLLFTKKGNALVSKIFMGRFERGLKEFFGTLASYLQKRKGLLLLNAAFALLKLALQACILYCIILGLGIQTDFMPLLLIVPASTVISMVPVTFSGLGLREGAIAVLLQRASIGAEAAVGAAFLGTMIDYAFVFIILAFFTLPKKTAGKEKAREIGAKYTESYDSEIRGLNGISEKEMEFIKSAGLSGDILDYGCGTGRFVKFFESKGAKITGFEPNRHMLKIARKKCASEILEKPPKKKFDCILLAEVLQEEGWREQEKILGEVTGLLKQRGRILVIFMNSINPLSWAVGLKDHVYPGNYFKIRGIMENSGLALVREDGIQLVPLPKNWSKRITRIGRPVFLSKWVMQLYEKK